MTWIREYDNFLEIKDTTCLGYVNKKYIWLYEDFYGEQSLQAK